MANDFSSRELINIAIGIERRGETFYDIMGRSSDNADARHVFQHLADMEREHAGIFQKMAADANINKSPGKVTKERTDYLQSLIDNAVFTDDDITSEMATQADSDIKALELGIMAEKDSILFYYEMKDAIPGDIAPLIDKIIIEEKAHLQELSAIKNKLVETGKRG
jgi:rubrerythrin